MRRLHFLLFAILIAVSPSLQADVVVMKDGTRYEGKITQQTNDLVKIEVAVTAKIKETKTFLTKDVAKIEKTAPDDLMFAKIKTMVPTQSMLSVDQYRSMLAGGPDAFLSAFSGSKHKDKVVAIKTTLEEELAKVEQGSLKIQGKWYSQADRSNFPKQIESAVLLYRMKSYVNGRTYKSLIAAMREYDALEKNYYGTPAHAEGLILAQKVIPALGRQLTNMRRDVDAINAKWESDKSSLDPSSRAKVEEAWKNEQAQFEASIAADKQAKIKWTQVNYRSVKSLDTYLQLAQKEMERVNAIDSKELTIQSEILVEADQLIADGKLSDAKVQLQLAKSSGSAKGSSTYSAALKRKLDIKLKELKEKAAEEAKNPETLVSETNNGEEQPETTDPENPPTETGETGKKTEVAEKETEEPRKKDDFSALARSVKNSKKETPTPAKKKPTKKTTTPKASTAVVDDYDESGGGISFQLILGAVFGVLLLVLILMKVLGGKKKES